MGQRRLVTVVKFVMNGSVESRLHDLATLGLEATKTKLLAAISSKQANNAIAGAIALRVPPLPAPLAASNGGGAGGGGGGGGAGTAGLSTSKTIVGHLRSDKIKLDLGSFDVLFGVA
jgi:hypothetical protein